MGQLKKISELETLASVTSGTYAPVVDASGNSKKVDLSGLNPTLKTINNQSLLGSGNISISGGKGISGTGENAEVFNNPNNKASGKYAHAEGGWGFSMLTYSEGSIPCTASGNSSHAEGYGTIASGVCSHAEGTFNIEDTDGYAALYSAKADAFIIGNGIYNWDGSELRSNAFRVTFSGATYGLSAFNSSGADYAEYFEWADGNTDNEDRIGHFVALVNGKIKIAEPNEDIIGIVSGMSSVIGNANEDMHHGMYLRDVFGRFIYEDVEVERPSHEYEKNEDGSYKEDENGKRIPIMETVTEHRIKLNPDYDATKPYVPRSQRAEWDVIGLLGQIVVIDDGTCIAGGRCDVAEGGIATNGNKYRVMKRLDDNHILVLANFL